MTHCAPCISPLAVSVRLAPPSIGEMVTAAAKHLSVSMDDIMSESRKTEVREPRQMIMAYLINERLVSCKNVDICFGRGYGTARNARKQVYALCYSDPYFRDTYTKLVNFLNGL